MLRKSRLNLAKQAILCAIVILLVFCPRSCPITHAWSVSGHQAIASKACRLFPGRWGDFFRYYEWLLNETVAYPDTFYKGRDPAEGSRHYVNLEVWNASRPETGTLPSAVETYGRSMADAIKAGDWNKVLLDAGRLSHYISDICQPYHSTVNYDPVTKSGIRLHAVWDAAIMTHLSEIRFISFIGTPQIVNLAEYALTLARQSYSFLVEINTTLIDLGQPWSSRLTEIVENRTNTAIIATTNVWHTAVAGSNANAPILPENKKLNIVATSLLQTIDVSRDSVFEFVVTDQLGVKVASEIRADIAGITLETESHLDLADPLGRYRTLLQANKLGGLGAVAEFIVIAQRSGYVPARLVVSVQVLGRPTGQPDYMIYVSIVASIFMLISFVLLVREYRKQAPM